MPKKPGDIGRREFLQASSAAAFASAGALSAGAQASIEEPRPANVDDIKTDNPHGGRLVAHALKREGVKYIFSLCGGHINPIFDGCLDEGIEIIGTRHEQAAAHMAEAWSLVTGQMGVCVVTAGPGVTDAVTGVANAYENHTPMLVLGGRSDVSVNDIGSLQDIDQMNLYESITKWSRVCYDTERIPEYVAMACRQALTGRLGPVYLELPQDVLYAKVPKSKVSFPARYRTTLRPRADRQSLRNAAEMLSKAERPVIIAGTGCLFSDAGDALAALAEHAGIPVLTHAGGRGVLPDSHPLALCPAGMTEMGGALLRSDVIIMLGVRLDFMLGYGRVLPASTKLIQVDIEPARIGFNRGPDVGIFADVKLVLEDLLSEIPKNPDRPWVAEIEQMKEANRKKRARTKLDSVPIHPRRLAQDVRDVCGTEATYVIDGGFASLWGLETLPAERPGSVIGTITGPMGCLGVGLPYALAAKVAEPDRRVVLFVGDGSFGLNVVEIDTAMRYNLPVMCVIANDQAWGMIKVGQIAAYGRDRVVGSELGLVRYDKWVESMGGHGEFVERPQDIKPALERALKSGKTSCVNVIIKTVPQAM